MAAITITAPTQAPALIPLGAGGNAAFPWNGVAFGGIMVGKRFQITVPTTIRYLLWEVTTTIAGNVDAGIITLTGANRLSYTRLLRTGNFAVPAVGVVRTDLGVTTLAPGDYMAVLASGVDMVVRGQGSRTDLAAQRAGGYQTGVSTTGIPASGTLSAWSTFDLALALEANV